MSQVTVGTTPVVAAGRNARRQGIAFYNKSTGGQVIDLSLQGAAGLTTTNSAYVLGPNVGIVFLLAFDGPDMQGEWGAISSLAGGVLVVGETALRDEER